MSGSKKSKSPKFDPVGALNALDLAMGSQEADAELADVIGAFVPLIEAVRQTCEGFDELPEREADQRKQRVAMLADLANRIVASLPLEPTAETSMPTDKIKHEIVDTIDTDGAPRGAIARVVEQGWEYRGILIRRAKVAIWR